MIMSEPFGNAKEHVIFIQDRSGKIYSRKDTESDFGNHFTLCYLLDIDEDTVLKWTWVPYDNITEEGSFGINHLDCLDVRYLPFEPTKTHLDAIEKFFAEFS